MLKPIVKYIVYIKGLQENFNAFAYYDGRHILPKDVKKPA